MEMEGEGRGVVSYSVTLSISFLAIGSSIVFLFGNMTLFTSDRYLEKSCSVVSACQEVD